MRQPATVEVRLDEHKAVSFGPAGPSILSFGCQRVGCDRISLPRNPQGRKIATNNFGIREMSVYMLAGIPGGLLWLVPRRTHVPVAHSEAAEAPVPIP